MYSFRRYEVIQSIYLLSYYCCYSFVCSIPFSFFMFILFLFCCFVSKKKKKKIQRRFFFMVTIYYYCLSLFLLCFSFESIISRDHEKMKTKDKRLHSILLFTSNYYSPLSSKRFWLNINNFLV